MNTRRTEYGREPQMWMKERPGGGRVTMDWSPAGLTLATEEELAKDGTPLDAEVMLDPQETYALALLLYVNLIRPKLAAGDGSDRMLWGGAPEKASEQA